MSKSEQKIKKSQKDDKLLSPPSPTKGLIIDKNTGVGDKVLRQFLPIVEMVVKKEYKSLPSHLAEYSELINVGLITVNKLLEDAAKNNKTYNSSYVAQAVKWAIKDELRTKYGWYGVKQTHERSVEDSTLDDAPLISEEEATERVFETILYLEDLPVGTSVQGQEEKDELVRLEFKELQQAVKRAISKLPPKHKRVMELRFYEGKRGNDVATELGVTPSRISHMIQDAIEKVRQSLTQEGFC